MSVLVIAESRRGQLRPTTLEAISVGLRLKAASGGRLAVAIVDADPQQHVPELVIEGVDELLVITSPVEHFEPHVMAAALSELIDSEQPAVLIAAHTVDSLGFAPALAAKKGLGFASDVSAVAWDKGPVVSRGAYGDRLVAEHVFPGKQTTFLLVRPGIFAAASAGAAAPPVREVSIDLSNAARSNHGGFVEPETGDVDITKAEFLLSVGRGIEDEGDLPRFEELAEKLGATLSASRPLIDAGWLPSDRQVGQSGKTVKPRVYLALGISGAVQHLAGMRGSETIIAVNTDRGAPIFGVADYGAVVDMFELAGELERAFE